MPKRPLFRDVQKELRACSIAPVLISRALSELQEHYDDLYAEALDSGIPASEAALLARSRLGEPHVIASAYRSHAELTSWSSRHPIAAACGRCLATAFVAPVMPVIYCYYHGSDIARWGASVGLAILVTGGLLLGLVSVMPFPLP